MILKLFYDVNEQLNKQCNKVHEFITFCAARLFAEHYVIKKIYRQIVNRPFFAQIFTLGLLQIHIAFVASKVVVDQQAAESQVSSAHIAQQRIGHEYGAPPVLDDPHHHHHEEHDPGFWKKKVTWKEGWKKYWVRNLTLNETSRL